MMSMDGQFGGFSYTSPSINQLYGEFGASSPEVPTFVQGASTDDVVLPTKKVASPETAGMEANIMQAFGINPNNMILGPDGYVKLTKEERGRVVGNSLALLGAGILQGAASGSWEGVAKGLSGGMAAATEAANKGRQEASDNRVKNEMTRIQGANAVLSAETAKYQLEKTKEKEAEKKVFEENIKKNISPLMKILNDGLKDVPIPENALPSEKLALKFKRDTLQLKIDQAQLMMESGDLDMMFKGIELINDVTPEIPGVAEPLAMHMASLHGKQLAASEQSKIVSNSQFREGVAEANKKKTYISDSGEKFVFGQEEENRQRALDIQQTSANNYGRNLFTGFSKPDIPGDADLNTARVMRDEKTQLASEQITIIENAASTIRNKLGKSELAGKSDGELIRDFGDPNSDVYKVLSGNSQSYTEIAKSLGVDLKATGLKVDNVREAYVRNRATILENLRRVGIGYDETSGGFNAINDGKRPININDRSDASKAVASWASYQMDMVQPSAETITRWSSALEMPGVRDKLNDLIVRYGGKDRLARYIESQGATSPDIADFIIALKQAAEIKTDEESISRANEATLRGILKGYLLRPTLQTPR